MVISVVAMMNIAINIMNVWGNPYRPYHIDLLHTNIKHETDLYMNKFKARQSSTQFLKN